MSNNNTSILIQVDLPVKCSLEGFNSAYELHYKNKISHEYIRNELNLGEEVKLKLNGTFKRNLYLLDDKDCLYKVMIKIQTALWYDPNTYTKHYVSIMPSFIKKYCPVSLTTLEHTTCETKEGENVFDHIDDPQGNIDCEDTISRPIKRIELVATKHKLSALLNAKYTEAYNTSLNMKDSDKESPRKYKVIYELIQTARKYFGVKFGVLSRINKLFKI